MLRLVNQSWVVGLTILLCLTTAGRAEQVWESLSGTGHARMSLSHPEVMTSGDMLTLTLTIKADPGVPVTLPGMTDDFGSFTIRQTAPSSKQGLQAGHAIHQTTLTLAPDVPGIHKLPALAITIGSKTLQTPSRTIKVVSVLPPDKIPFKPLGIKKEPAPEPGPSPWLLWAIYACLAIFIFLLMLLWLMRNPKPKTDAAPPQAKLDVPTAIVMLRECDTVVKIQTVLDRADLTLADDHELYRQMERLSFGQTEATPAAVKALGGRIADLYDKAGGAAAP